MFARRPLRRLLPALALLLASAWPVATAARAAGTDREVARRRAFQELHAPGPTRVIEDHHHLRIRVHTPDVEVPAPFLAAGHEAVERLERVFGDLEDPVEVRVGGAASTLHIAYSPAEDAVIIPEAAGLIDHGLGALDHLRHELFHAVVGRKHPSLVEPEVLRDEEQTAVHEGAADYFASLLDDNETFGDGYRRDPPPLRRYRTELRWDLVVGSHARGNALTAYLVEHRVPLAEVAAAFTAAAREGRELDVRDLVASEDRPAFGLGPEGRCSVAITLDGAPPSRLGRLRVPEGATLCFRPDARFAEGLGDLEVRLTDRHGRPSPGYAFEPLPAEPPGVAFRVRCRPDASGEKMIARYRTGGRLVGFGVLYLQPAR